MSGTGTPDYQLSYITDRLTIAILKGIWHDQRLFYDVSGNIIYKCCHEMHKAPTADETWEVWKFTWVGTNCTRIEGPLKGSVDGRATLAWG
jgi:hypothetical protein